MPVTSTFNLFAMVFLDGKRRRRVPDGFYLRAARAKPRPRTSAGQMLSAREA
jgi:hypothetical protein